MLSATKIFIKNPILNKYLFVLRDNKKEIFYPNVWELLGGAIEEGESPEDSIKRELSEEIDVVVNKIKFFKKIKTISEMNNKKFPSTLYIFKGEINLDVSEITLNEGQRLGYFSLNKILEIKTTPWLKDFIINHKNLL